MRRNTSGNHSYSPREFLRRFPDGAVIDEAQRAPALLSELQGLIEQGQALAGVEIKAGSRVASDAAVSLRKWQRHAGELETYLGVVYGGDEAYDRDGVSVLPWRDL